MDEQKKQALCMMELYVEDNKLCVEYGHNATDLFAERRMLEKLWDFLDKRLEDIHKEVMNKIKEEK